ncbi:MAG: hypothetical protein PHS49_00520 [Candidatus Gracilibacteria bacterium]|nr:hypothetical protein [Candidatus Gracilibacteria bacterium]
MEIKKIDTKKGYWAYDIRGVIVDNIPEGFACSIHAEIIDFLLEGEKIPKYDDNRNIITNIYGDFIYIEYSDAYIRNKDIKNNNKINKTNMLKSEVIDGTRQIAENIGDFEYNGKYYLVLHPVNSTTSETNPEKGLFRGVIVDYDKYYGLNSEVESEVKDTSGKVDTIL